MTQNVFKSTAICGYRDAVNIIVYTRKVIENVGRKIFPERRNATLNILGEAKMDILLSSDILHGF